jgi:4-hydroxy-4-methyl-2-oxoglutarate aldolase
MQIETPRETLIELTRLNPFDRFPNGRPRIPDELLRRMESVTSEQAWSVLQKHNYNYQFEGNWFQTHPRKILVGRAVTAMMVPYRPDFHDLVQETGVADGRIGGQNSWVIDTLEIDDVLVVDMFGKVKDGTFLGDNLSTSVQTRTKRGAVIDGGIRDYQGVMRLPECAIFCRGVDPTPIAHVTLVGINIPIRIGGATVLPGDVVLGTPTGVHFIPPHLAQEVVEHAEDIQMRDRFGQFCLRIKRYTPGEIDVTAWPERIETDYQMWLQDGAKEEA